jgi:hypothetical protein
MPYWFAAGTLAALVACRFAWRIAWAFARRRWIGKGRTRELSGLAETLGLAFIPFALPREIPGATGVRLDAIGTHSKLGALWHGRPEVANLVYEWNEAQCLSAFDFHYVAASRRRSSARWNSMIVFWAPKVAIPRFTLSAETIGDFAIWGDDPDIDFDTHPRFSLLYALNGTDEASIREFFSPQLLGLFEREASLFVGGEWRGGDGAMMFRLNHRREPAEFVRVLSKCRSVWNLANDA